MKKTSTDRKILFFRNLPFVLVLSYLLLNSVPGFAGEDDFDITPASISPFTSPDTILVPKARSWLVPLLLPYLKVGSDNRELPVILILPDGYGVSFNRYLADIKSSSILSFVDPVSLGADYPVKLRRLRSIQTPETPFKASLQFLRVYSQPNSPIVLTSMANPAEFIRASLFAAHTSLPLLLVKSTLKQTDLERVIRERGPSRLYLIGTSVSLAETDASGTQLIRLSTDQVDGYLIRKMEVTSITNLIISNPDPAVLMGQPADANPVFYSPYISLLRNAPIVFPDSNTGNAAETAARAFIDKHGINPRTITLLGNYNMIGTTKPGQKLREQIYHSEMELEPFSIPGDGTAIPFGVGRLPFDKIDCLSMYYARLIRLTRKRVQQPPQFTMIANLASDKREKLMLAESISRATVNEMRNFRFHGHEFYGMSPQNTYIWNTALESDLIIYEGHIEEFTMIKKADSPESEEDHYVVPYFKQFPFLILQSCESLKSHEILLDSGISGMIGACSKLHSASGSAFIKTLVDSMLYDKASNGEALRDAKNYSLGMVKLKNARGHTEQDKTLRSALTFRLMGDPESRLFGEKIPDPCQMPVKARYVSERDIEIITPPRTYPEIRNNDFTIKAFPRSEAADIVTRIDHSPDSLWQINTFYYFRLPAPKTGQFNASPGTIIKDNALRTVSLEDPFGRWIYILHFPRKESANRTIRFELIP